MSNRFEFIVPLLSLVDDELNPLPELIAAHLYRLKDNGVHGVLVMGTTGEFPGFSVQQRQQYLETVQEVNPGLNVMVNVGAAAFQDVLDLQAHALSQPQVTELLWMPPFYYPGSSVNGLEAMLMEILRKHAEDIPFLVYHYPKMSQVSFEPDFLEKFPQLAGLKDTSGDYDRIGRLVQRFPHYRVYTGTDYEITRSRELGCHGIISGMGNVFPELIHQVIHHGEKSLEARLKQYRTVFGHFCKIPAMKAYLNSLALNDLQTSCALPFQSLTHEEIDQLLAAIAEIKEGHHANAG